MPDPFLKIVKRVLRLFPGPLFVLFGIWCTLSLALTAHLLPYGSKQTGAPELSTHRLKKHLTTLPARKRTLRLHVSGPGRGQNWNPERIRRFYFVKELTYTSRFPSASSPPFPENRRLNRYRFLLISSPRSQRLTLKSGITDVLHALGPSDSILPMGKNGYPIGPITPEKLTEEEESKLMEFIRDGSDRDDSRKKIIRFISPYEGSSFSLNHRIRNGRLSTSLAEGSPQISGLERNFLLNAPSVPELYLPDPTRDNTPVSNESSLGPFSVSGLDRYLQAFFQFQLEGGILLRQNGVGRRTVNFTGSGSFNILRQSGRRQIGEILVDNVELTYDSDRKKISYARLHGRIALTTVPTGHVLQRIQFLRKPEFRISYTSRPTTDD